MLNIFALNNIRDQKEINRYQIYKKVLKKCHHRIKVVSSKGESFCFYVVPEYIYGVPRFDTLTCANYIVRRLQKNGFKILYTYPNLIFISRDHIPSEFKNSQKPALPDSTNQEQTQNFRYIEDYKPSKNFLRKISKKKPVKKIKY